MYGFVYIWRDKKHNRYYIGSHWGQEDDGYICSSQWMKRSYSRREKDFRRKIISRIYTSRLDLLAEEQRWLNLIKPSEVKIKYYNLMLRAPKHWYHNDNNRLSIGQKISRAKKGKNTGERPESVGRAISESKRKKFIERRELTGSSFTEEHRKAMSECKLGKKQTEESNRKRSETMKLKHQSGEIVLNRGPLSEEHRAKIGEKLRGKTATDEAKSNMSRAQSKTYMIKLFDGTDIKVVGLKTYCINNGIPYVTARKAVEARTPIKKYKVLSIEELISNPG